MKCASENKTCLICFHSDYVKMFDGNDTEIFASHGWDSTSSNKSLQQLSFGESKNITIQVSLVHPSSYVRIDYGMLKEPLALGREADLLSCARVLLSIWNQVLCYHG